ncbi:MAG: hypothetical protein U5K69_19700 [Balneolaceae bacterium]|nr:hypothetical protein [Balneolaceae bacterium]
MSAVQPESQPFTRHLFSSACDCPTKLFYKAQPDTYPEKKEQLPFLAHIRYNKRQLRQLLQLCYPQGIHVKERDYQKGARETADLLKEEYAIIFHASFLNNNLFARVPVLEKDGNRVRVFHLKTKAFNPKRHSLTDRNQNLHSKWRGYIRNFAYLSYVIGQNHPEWKLEPYLVLPDKTATAEINCLDQKLSNGYKIDPKKVSKLLAFVDVQDQINRFLSGKESIVEEDWRL